MYLLLLHLGRFLKNILDLPRYGCVNVHVPASSVEGASPIQSAILAGDQETGVTIMLMDGIDTGPMLAQEKHQ